MGEAVDENAWAVAGDARRAMDLDGTATIRFGTDGWRAIMCDTFTFSNVRLVCQAIAEHLKQAGIDKQGVVVAHDARFMAERFCP